MTYVKEGKDVATLRAEQDAAEVKALVDLIVEARRLVNTQAFRSYAADLAYHAAGFSEESPEPPEWMPRWARELATNLVMEAQGIASGSGGQAAVERAKQAVTAAREREDFHA